MPALIQNVNIGLLIETIDVINSNAFHRGQNHAEMLASRLAPRLKDLPPLPSLDEVMINLLQLNKPQAIYLTDYKRTLPELNEIIKAWTIADYTSCSPITVALSPFEIPVEDAIKFAKSTYPDVRKAIAGRYNLMFAMPEIARELASDEIPKVRREIAEHPDLMATMPDIARKLAKDKNYHVRQAIAGHPDLMTIMPDIARALATDEESEVREAIAKHPDLMKIMPEVAYKLSKDEKHYVQQAIVERADLTESLCKSCKYFSWESSLLCGVNPFLAEQLIVEECEDFVEKNLNV